MILENLVAGALTIEADERTPGRIKLAWKGRSADRHPRLALAPYFATVAARAGELGATIEMNFEQLEHFNSSTITVFIQFIQDLKKKKLGLVLLYQSECRWQRLSFDALRIFQQDDGLLRLEPKGQVAG